MIQNQAPFNIGYIQILSAQFVVALQDIQDIF